MTGAAAAGALVAAGIVVAGAVTGLADAVAVVTPAGVSVFTDSVSALGDSVAGFALSSLAGDDGFVAAAVNSATGLSTAVTGACAFATTAVSKLKVITVNEATMRTGELKADISHLLFTFAAGETSKD